MVGNSCNCASMPIISDDVSDASVTVTSFAISERFIDLELDISYFCSSSSAYFFSVL